jgi:PAS domain S-box-containing protein
VSFEAPAASPGDEPLPANILDAEAMLVSLAAVAGRLAPRVGARAGSDELPGVQEMYRLLVEQIPAVVFMAHLDRGISDAYVSPQIEASLGYSQEEWLEDPIRWYDRIHPDDRHRWSIEAAHMVTSGEPLRSDYRVLARDGRVVWFHCEAKLVRDAHGNPTLLHGVAFDVTERRLSEEKFRGLLESAPDAMVIADQNGRIALVNSQAEAMFGYSREELLNRPIEILIPQRFAQYHAQHRTTYAGNPRVRQLGGVGPELFGQRKDGSEFPVEISLSPLLSDEGMLVSSAIRDISGRRQAEQRLRDSLAEKEVLLREIHHRVKNNLAVISSLFYLESTYTDDQATLRLLQESQDRVRSMALVHEMLYGSENLAAVDFSTYAADLCAHLIETYAQPGGRIRLTRAVEPMRLNIDQAVPCGLVLNEIMSNALKHAFPAGRAGEVHLGLREDNGYCVLSITDNGLGIAPNIDLQTHRSLGLRLIRTLARQLDGNVDVELAHPGTTFRLRFPLRP